MKKTFLFLMIAPLMMAQSVFDTYKSNERVTYASISPQMFSMLAKLNIDDTDPEAKEFLELISQINTFKLLRTDEPSISDNFSDWTQEYAKTNQLTELMQVREDQTTVNFYAALSEKENIVDQLVMLAQEYNDNAGLDDRNQTVLLYIDGKIDLARIASLVQKLDIPAGEELNKLKGQVKI
ncbi:MAG: DUF4252 domain-containing protein [Bacteroidota bacterium]|nr:DUF4252 domain-containing protein [Bacteroidota bacterium]MEC8637671.1 DUF4252 domain-containing protein [Bacteroidota bacterium]